MTTGDKTNAKMTVVRYCRRKVRESVGIYVGYTEEPAAKAHSASDQPGRSLDSGTNK